jgi:chromate transport protein ChrA
MLLLWNLWQVVRKEAETRRSYLTTAVAAIYSTIFVTGLFDISLFGMMFLFFAISNKSSSFSEGETKHATQAIGSAAF